MTERQLTALNNLYAATIEVLQAFSPQMVDQNMRNQALAGVIDNFMRNMACACTQTIGDDSSECSIKPVVRSEDEQIIENSLNSELIQTEVATINPEDNIRNVSGIGVADESKNEEKRYGTRPTFEDDSWFFKRIKQKDNCDPLECYYYEMIICGEYGTFKLNPETANPSVLDATLIPESIIKVEGGVAKNIATSVSNIRAGRIVKEKKSWKVVEPLIIQFN